MRATYQESYSDVIRKIEVDLHSRDDIPALIRGLQHIYVEDHLRMKWTPLSRPKIALYK